MKMCLIIYYLSRCSESCGVGLVRIQYSRQNCTSHNRYIYPERFGFMLVCFEFIHTECWENVSWPLHFYSPSIHKVWGKTSSRKVSTGNIEWQHKWLGGGSVSSGGGRWAKISRQAGFAPSWHLFCNLHRIVVFCLIVCTYFLRMFTCECCHAWAPGFLQYELTEA